MKKPYIIIAAAFIALLGARFALADSVIYLSHPSISPHDYENTATASPQLGSGTITGWTINPTGCQEYCTGAGASTITTGLFINGVEVSSSTGGTGYSGATSTVTGLAIPFSPGDILSLQATWGYNTAGITGTITGTGLSNETGYTPTLSFLQPTGGSTAPDFATWKLLGEGTPTDGVLYRFDVTYSQLGTSESYDDFNLANSNFSPEEFDIEKSMALATGTEWSAQGFLYATSSTATDLDPGDAIATTSVIFFNVGTSTVITTTSTTPPIVSVCPTAPPIFQLTGSLPYFVINNPIPSIISGGCNILSAAFIMSSDQIADINSRYSNAGAIIGVKPPLGYFTIVTGAFGSFASGSSSISLLPSASSTDALSPIFAPLDEGLSACVGLLGAFWILRRLKHIQP